MGKVLLIRHDPDTLFYARPAAPTVRAEWRLTLLVAIIALAVLGLTRLAGVDIPVPLEFASVLP